MKKRGRIILGGKAQAGVIALIIIILIAVIIVIIFYNFYNSFVKGKSSEIETSSMTIELEVRDIVLFVTGESRISVKRLVGKGNLDGLRFVFFDENGNSHIETKREILPSELETKTYYFSSFSDFSKLKDISVFPLVGRKIGREFNLGVDKAIYVPAGIVSWFRFDEGINDFVSGNSGELRGNAKIDDGDLVLNGTSFFEVKNNSNLSIAGQGAISSWIKINDYGGEIVRKGDLNKNYLVYLNSEGKIVFNYTYSGVSYSLLSDRIIPIGEWTYIVVSVDFSGVSKIFINGEESAVNYSSGNPDLNSDSVLVGKFFNGRIDELMIFNSSLTSSQVNSLYVGQRKI